MGRGKTKKSTDTITNYDLCAAVINEAKAICEKIEPDKDYAFICSNVPGGDVDTLRQLHPEVFRRYGKIKRSKSRNKNILADSSGKRFN